MEYGLVTVSAHSPIDVSVIVPHLVVSLSASLFIDLGCHFSDWEVLGRQNDKMSVEWVRTREGQLHGTKAANLHSGCYTSDLEPIAFHGGLQSEITTTALEQSSRSDSAGKDGCSSSSSVHFLYVTTLWAWVMLVNQVASRQTEKLPQTLRSPPPGQWAFSKRSAVKATATGSDTFRQGFSKQNQKQQVLKSDLKPNLAILHSALPWNVIIINNNIIIGFY